MPIDLSIGNEKHRNMKTAADFLSAIERRAKLFAPSATATFRANKELCSWVLDPLARWADAAYGEKAFDDAALGYAVCAGAALVLALLGPRHALRVRAALAAACFALFGDVRWLLVLPLAAGFLIGGWIGPKIARRVPAGVLRVFVSLCGLGLAVKLGVSAYH